MKFLKKLLFTVFPFILLGCSSIVDSGDLQKVSVSSTPGAAEVVIKDEKGATVFQGQTPLQIPLNRSNGYMDGATYTVEISKPGYQTRMFKIKSSPSGWYLGGNIAFGWLIGWLVVDPVTGNMWDLDPRQINATLQPDVKDRKDVTFRIIDADQLSAEETKNLKYISQPAAVVPQPTPLPPNLTPSTTNAIAAVPVPTPSPTPKPTPVEAKAVAEPASEDSASDLAAEHFKLAIRFANAGPKFYDSARYHYGEALKYGKKRDTTFERIIQWHNFD